MHKPLIYFWLVTGLFILGVGTLILRATPLFPGDHGGALYHNAGSHSDSKRFDAIEPSLGSASLGYTQAQMTGNGHEQGNWNYGASMALRAAVLGIAKQVSGDLTVDSLVCGTKTCEVRLVLVTESLDHDIEMVQQSLFSSPRWLPAWNDSGLGSASVVFEQPRRIHDAYEVYVVITAVAS